MMVPALLLVIALVSFIYVMWPSWGRKTKYGGEHVLITGGSRGIGLALAKEFIRRDANVTLVGRTLSDLEEAVTQLKAVAEEVGVDPEIHICPMDVRDLLKVRAALW
jgi:NAD(P)-dependent dehydrogenase (short-subunit alcohol dehydrogenase family)